MKNVKEYWRGYSDALLKMSRVVLNSENMQDVRKGTLKLISEYGDETDGNTAERGIEPAPSYTYFAERTDA